MNTVAMSLKKFARPKMLMQKLGKLPQPLRSKSKSVAMLLVASLLCGCAPRLAMDTISVKNPKTVRKILCDTFKGLDYNSGRDDPRTVYGAQVHNQTGENLGCKKISPQNNW